MVEYIVAFSVGLCGLSVAGFGSGGRNREDKGWTGGWEFILAFRESREAPELAVTILGMFCSAAIFDSSYWE